MHDDVVELVEWIDLAPLDFIEAGESDQEECLGCECSVQLNDLVDCPTATQEAQERDSGAAVDLVSVEFRPIDGQEIKGLPVRLP